MRDATPAALALLEQYDWPGNVRELRNLIERMTVLHGEAKALQPQHLPAEVQCIRTVGAAPAVAEIELPASLEEHVAELERRLICQALAREQGNVSKAAVLLQTTRRILKYKIDQYGLASQP
jgi:DNA-binding NtrC family response regulator